MKTKYIALLSDFGTHDPFVGAMKGVLLSKAPGLTIIDITHQIPPQDIQTAAFYLMAAVPYMPKGTLFMSVVDPTVGTGRGIIWAKTEHYQFIAPDNGLISWVEQKEKIKEARFINNSSLFMENISSTFHGRDIFAPVAAHLSRGVAFEKLGPKVEATVGLSTMAAAHATKKGIEGSVIYIERFGNAVTNISSSLASQAGRIRVKGRTIPLRGSYSDVAQGNPGLGGGGPRVMQLGARISF